MLTTNKTPRIAVYTICKNESKFVRSWVENMYCNGHGADMAYILDTGSSDNTVELFHETLKDLHIPEEWLRIEETSYDQFRFDIARNDNLAMIKDEDNIDALVSIDLDETMIEDFWSDLRAVVAEHPNFNRVYYKYAWNHDEDGNPKRVFWYDKIHPAKDCRWIHPVHEELVVDNPERVGTYRLDENKIYLHHWADLSKSRSSYLPLLEIRAQESPDDIYGLYYLMREHIFADPDSLRVLQIATDAYLKISSNRQHDDYDCLPFFILAMADIYNRWGIEDDAEYYYKKAIDVAPHLRQPYLSYASFCAYHGRDGKWKTAIEMLDLAEEKTPTKYSTWYETDYNWTWRPLQIRAVAYCWAGIYGEAKKLFQEAEKKYIKTPVDKQEAELNNFYADYNWLKDYLKKNK